LKAIDEFHLCMRLTVNSFALFGLVHTSGRSNSHEKYSSTLAY